ncbi:hypothetical protein [Cupriavidus sp. DF5525]
MRTSTLLFTCITTILVVGAVVCAVLPTMASIARTLTAALAIAQ